MSSAICPGASQFELPQRNVGSRIIAPRRASSAHLHRPWRALAYFQMFQIGCARSAWGFPATPRLPANQHGQTPFEVGGPELDLRARLD